MCSVQSYLVVAMIRWYDPQLRAANARVWDELQFAWHATFHSDLAETRTALEKWPVAGSHAFDEIECNWLKETLRCLKS